MSILAKIGDEWRLINTPSDAFDGVIAPESTSQSQSAGTSLADVTFDSFTDSINLISSYSISIKNGNGTTSWSGTGLGPYSASGDIDGSSGTLMLNALDSLGNILATAIHTYHRGQAGGSWNVIEDLDFTGLDSLDLTPPDATLQTFSITKSGSPFATLYVDYSGAGLVYDISAGASGIRAEWVSGVSNYLNIMIDFASFIGKTAPMTAEDLRGRYAIQYKLENITWPGANAERIHASIGSSNTSVIANGDSLNLSLGDNGLGGSTVGFYVGSDVIEYTNAGVQPTECIMEHVICNGQMSDSTIYYSNSYNNPYSSGYGPMLLYRSPVKGQPYPVDLATSYVGICWRRKINATWTGIRVLKYE